MAQPTYSASRPQSPNAIQEPRTLANGYVFGAPVKDLGWFASLLMGLATGMASFFAATFAGIVFILIYNSSQHGVLDYSWSYKRIGLPIGVLAATVALSYLAWMWSRRQLKRA